ncbi:cell division ATP-binding protein FtsE [bacterium (Candidatus Blackallbacteria) CG17_big_fil_post_rev_8_21_14_2_50_48_46]|uniref:Cell division ATP-binding protein FtsE n=1 Tax=bacterium (Candidatus Blackallbacteria) CG17_big_fil_post_rev_8_21_14_2_50_48_46 TaxID=2014261 RepID=A0A2M7FYP1_9BACT|nr:MAG: cell division ATP-binding protein FtsE [bacterium (Candidatus Blackallbacteria) CG18_big_fil_WC_8_21_14_2_50_49_26]PIW14177.1 MAG: cell division ATP-binding protein FtsE [bacterium (Candidatus Blackallbacteria) CG17_big_fil_post_rev_8_21_14_2_50_48_46]PIW46718.1 MAG: cell division ATP-binding protein FtsE [bacterium (Candidatus Blackallbacteria) CG13_big_fil_rev_8_21_14_2_50_49_14]
MIRFVNISKTYSTGVKALVNINLEIEPGSFTFLVGTTGSGKSTLMRLLFREELASSGEIWVFGKNIENLTRHEVPVLRQQTGVIFQDFKLIPQKTVWENIAFALEIMGVSKKEQNSRIESVLELTNMSQYAHTFPTQLSGGEQQRVSVARAIVNKPPLLLADEPTGNLDPDTSWEIMKLLSKISAAGTTVLVSTHNKHLVDLLQRRVVKLDKGRIVEDTLEGGYNQRARRK